MEEATMKLLLLIFAALSAIAKAEEAFEINWDRVVPILSLKEFWENNDFPEIFRPKYEDLVTVEKTEGRIVGGSEVM
jgi:hypothetical protein